MGSTASSSANAFTPAAPSSHAAGQQFAVSIPRNCSENKPISCTKLRRMVWIARIRKDVMKRLLHARIHKGSDRIPPAEFSEPMNKSRGTGGCLVLIRFVVGGGICGGFLGIFGGALLGTLYGVWIGDLSGGLDGALVGSAVLAVLGAVYGLACGLGGGSETSCRLLDGEVTGKSSEDFISPSAVARRS